MDLFDPFTAVKELYMSCEIRQYITASMDELIGDGLTEVAVLPALQTRFLESLPSDKAWDKQAIDQFFAARQPPRHPIAISRWRREDEDEED